MMYDTDATIAELLTSIRGHRLALRDLYNQLSIISAAEAAGFAADSDPPVRNYRSRKGAPLLWEVAAQFLSTRPNNAASIKEIRQYFSSIGRPISNGSVCALLGRKGQPSRLFQRVRPGYWKLKNPDLAQQFSQVQHSISEDPKSPPDHAQQMDL